MKQNKLISDDISFFLVPGLFNLRGADIEYNPVFFAYAVVGLNTIR